jgi:hypothetical protein
VDALPLVFSSGWASGINAYLVVLVLGIAERVGGFAEIPDALGRWDVLAAAGVLYAMEFVADKIPYVDSAWDVVSTAIRPTAGAVIGVLLAGDADSLEQAVAGVVGGGTALLSHAEDLTVLAVVWFAIENPRAAAAIAGVLLIFGLGMLYLVARLVRRGWRRLRRRRQEVPT